MAEPETDILFVWPNKGICKVKTPYSRKTWQGKVWEFRSFQAFGK